MTALLAVVAIVGRLAGPSDLWDQAQPRTVAYTVDILVHGGSSWILPRDADGLGATKPPLYNWLALPFIAAFGRTSEIAHRLPSLLAFFGTLAIAVALGERLARGVGWLAALMLVACYPMLKLGTIARPDMLLVFLLFAAFVAATVLLAMGASSDDRVGPPVGDRVDGGADAGIRDRRAELTRFPRGVWQAIFWSAIVASSWTKGPAAILPALYALCAARVICGRFSASSAIGWWWGIPALLGMAGWPIAVWFIAPDHLTERLWQQELAGRVMGSGTEGGGRGLLGIVLGLPAMPAYFMIRFAPWSLLTIAAVVAMVSTREPGRAREPAFASGWSDSSDQLGDRMGDRMTGLVLRGAVVWIALVLILFSLSSGKRADYIAPVFPVAALLTAWWVIDSMGSRHGRRMQPAIGVACAAAVAVVGAVVAVAWLDSPIDRGGSAALGRVSRLARAEREAIIAEASGTPIVATAVPAEHFPATIATGRPLESAPPAVVARLDSGAAMLLFHDRLHADDEIVGRLAALEVEGRLETRWSVDVPWNARRGVALRNVTCTLVHARR